MITPIFVTINPEIQKQAAELFSSMGIDMTAAVNFLLYQCVLNGGLPFGNQYDKDTFKAVIQASTVPNNPNGENYDPMAWFKGFNK